MTVDDVDRFQPQIAEDRTEFELPHPISPLTTRFQVAAGLVGRAVCS